MMSIYNFVKELSILKSNHVTGLHCNMKDGNNAIFSYVILVRNKGRVEIESQAEIQCDIGNLNEYLNKRYPVFLSIEGTGILHKQVQNDPVKSAFQLAIPNANESDFIYELYEGVAPKMFISFARKELISNIINSLNNQKFSVIGLTISPFSCTKLYNMFPNLPALLSTGKFDIYTESEGHEIISFAKRDFLSESEYEFDKVQVSSRFLLPFYNALTYYFKESDKEEYSLVEQQKTEYISKRIYDFAGGGILILIFLILLINMVTFSALSEERQTLLQEVSINKELITKLNLAQEELSWKERFLGQSGKNYKEWFSVFADKLGASVPSDITLEKLDFHPIKTKIINKKEIELQNDIIHIEGISGSSSAVNSWTLTLKRLPLVSEVMIESFSQLENSSLGVFTIEIRLKTSAN